MNLLRRFEAAIILAGLLAIGIVAYSLHLTRNTLDQLLPLVQISNDLKVKVSSSHLWFEEALQGDNTINLNIQVYGNIDEAVNLVQEQLLEAEQIDPALFLVMSGSLKELKNELQIWKTQTATRWTFRTTSQAGTDSDAKYDASFLKILRLCDENKRQINDLVSDQTRTIRNLNLAFMLFLIVLFSVLTAIFVRYRRDMEKKNLALTKLSQAVEQTDDLVMITNKDGIIEYVNPSFEKLTSYTGKETVGRKPSMLKSGGHEHEFYEALWRSIVEGKVFRAEMINRKKNGELFYEEKTISPIRDTHGNITHYVSTGKDITARKAMEKELMHSREMKVIGQIASGVAHEVRNPLNAILAISEAMFHDFSGQAEYSESLNHIRNQVNRLSALMRDLLELGKPIPASTMRNVSLADVCRGSIDLWKQYHPESTHAVRLIEPAMKARVVVNKEKLQQVFVNLLDNAAQNSPERSEIQMIVREPEPSFVRICVKDQCAGVPPEMVDKIFEPFVTSRKTGTGLGLTIVKHIIETHGGMIGVRNNDSSAGCCMEIQLPIAGEK